MNNKTTEESNEPMSPTKVVRLGLYAVIFLCGLIGNLLVIIVVRARGKRRSFHDYFLLNLAVADLLFILCLPADIYVEMARFPFTQIYCKLIYPLTTFAFSLSIFTLTSMAVGRCYIMQSTSRSPIKGKIAFLWIVLLWFSSLVCVLPLSIIARSAPDACREDWPNKTYRKTYTAALLVLQYIGPLVIIAFAYVHIGILLTKKKPPKAQDTETAKRIALRIKQRNLQIIRTLAVIVILFAILMLPHEITWMLIDFGSSEHQNAINVLIKFSPILTYLHSSSNPLVYGLMISQFRSDVKKCICCDSLQDFHDDYIDDENGNASRTSRNLPTRRSESIADGTTGKRPKHNNESELLDENQGTLQPLITKARHSPTTNM